jgi:hypothetical protein
MEHRLNSLSSSISSIPRTGISSGDLQNVKDELIRRMEGEASILSEQETSLDIMDGAVLYKIRVIPKEWNKGEKVFITVDGVKNPATSPDNTWFEAQFSLKELKAIQPVVSFEAAQMIRREALQEVPLEELLRLGVEWKQFQQNSEDKRLELWIMPLSENGAFLLQDELSLQCMLTNGFNSQAIHTVSGSYKKREGKALVYEFDLSAITIKDGSYALEVEIKSTVGLSYRSEGAFGGIEVREKQLTLNDFGEYMLDPTWK